MTTPPLTRIAILISGRGSNMIALSKAIVRGEVPGAQIVLVVSDKPNAAGLDAATGLGIETLVVERRGRSRASAPPLSTGAAFGGDL